ncbi:MAG: hypothetical protein EOM01_07250 [Spirochaetia bacterium]|nr:hypothetical protein [Spirochaetia bacterium]
MIGNVINKARYTVLSTTPVVSGYSIPFKYWDVSQISVILTSSTGVETQVASASLSVTSPGDTGTLTFAAGYTFPEGTSVLTVVRTLTIEQLSDYRNGDVMDAEQLEKSFDMTVAMLQELNEKLARTVRIPISDPASSLQMPSSLVRANMLLGFDASGNIIPILTSEIEQNLADALAAETSVDGMYNDAGMVAVRTDMALGASSKILAVANNKTNIDTVATAITNVNAVGTNIANVNAAASNATNINAAVANSSNINAVVSNATNINLVAGDKANIDAVAANKVNIDAVAANEADIDVVATDLNLGAASKVKIVADDKTNIDAVAANKTNIDAVAGNATNINAVNTNKTNIDTVATDLALGASSNVKKVADAIANVNAVGTDIAKVNAVQAKLTEVDNVSDNMTAVVNAHTNMAAIIAAPTQATNAATARTAAEAARDKARKWSEEIEDTPVETGEYSAKHHALKAAASAASAHLADAAANKQLTIDGTLYQYALQQASNAGHLKISFVEVV